MKQGQLGVAVIGAGHIGTLRARLAAKHPCVGFLAISDQGGWFTGSIRYSGGKMVGLDDVEASPLLGAEGRPITEKRFWYDTESLARDGNVVEVDPKQGFLVYAQTFFNSYQLRILA